MTTIIPIPDKPGYQLRFESCTFGDRPQTFIRTTYSIERLTESGPVVEQSNTFPASVEDVALWEAQLGQVIRPSLESAILNHYNSTI
jgi:hypothetical protein